MSIVGQLFAYRERAHTPGDPLRPVEVTKDGPTRSQKVRIRWLDGEYQSLEEWVPRVRVRTATIQMNVHFLGAVDSGRITCESEVLHRTRRTATAEAKVHDADGNLVALGTGAFRVFESRGSAIV